jgi:hypothetical protein
MKNRSSIVEQLYFSSNKENIQPTEVANKRSHAVLDNPHGSYHAVYLRTKKQ